MAATTYDPSWYKAWHTWALANYEVINHFDSQGQVKEDLPGQALVTYIVQSITGIYRLFIIQLMCLITCSGFFHSIALSTGNALQDILRLLTLWFKYGAHDDVSHAMAGGFTDVEIDTWLEVIPQVRLLRAHHEL